MTTKLCAFCKKANPSEAETCTAHEEWDATLRKMVPLLATDAIGVLPEKDATALLKIGMVERFAGDTYKLTKHGKQMAKMFALWGEK